MIDYGTYCEIQRLHKEGLSARQIAHQLKVGRRTVRQWLNRYQQHGLPGLTIQWAPGQPGRIPESFASTLHQWVIEGPHSCGLDRANWTYEELAVHFYRTSGIEVKRTAMRVFCQRHQIRPYRPTYRYLRGDPHKQQAAREELAVLKKRRRPVSACC